jgi:hypothetical protein
MTKTQIDERRYIMPQLRRYELLTLEIMDRELHSHEVIEKVLESLPRYTSINRRAVILSMINENREANEESKVVMESQLPGTECVICLEKCEAARP